MTPNSRLSEKLMYDLLPHLSAKSTIFLRALIRSKRGNTV